MAAIAGYPHLTVPMGTVDGLPIGLSFIGGEDRDAQVLALGHAYERKTDRRVEPRYLPGAEARPDIAAAMRPRAGSPSGRAAEEDGTGGDVLAAAAAIVAAFGRHDPEAYFALFDPAATFVFHTTLQRLEDRAAYRREWAGWESDLGFRVRSCTSSDPRVQLLGDTAVFTHSVRTVLSTHEGESTLDERETIVFQRRDGRWIAVHEHLSPLPGP
jgi:ketosteroid isomerase-like protein